jgi:hypothetical protein
MLSESKGTNNGQKQKHSNSDDLFYTVILYCNNNNITVLFLFR